MTPPLGVFSGVYWSRQSSWVLGLWSPCTRKLCASSWPSTQTSAKYYSAHLCPFAFICGKKGDIE